MQRFVFSLELQEKVNKPYTIDLDCKSSGWWNIEASMGMLHAFFIGFLASEQFNRMTFCFINWLSLFSIYLPFIKRNLGVLKSILTLSVYVL